MGDPEAPPSATTLYALLFVSGASSLSFEIIWVRALGLSFGTSVPAVTTVVAAFMMGLALGSLLFGRYADRHPQPIRLYSLLEFGVGTSSILVSLLLLASGGAMRGLATLAEASGPLLPLVRFVVFFAFLVVPTTLMGATLPVLVRALARSHTEARVMGTLYAANTAGAVVGVLLPDGLLIANLGLTQTVLLAASGNLIVSLLARRLAFESAPPRATEEPSAPLPRAPVALFAVSGFCAIAYEIIWSRLLEQLLGAMIVAFSVLLGVNLLALALGSRWASSRADRHPRPLAAAAWALTASGVAAALPLVFLPWWMRSLTRWFPRDPAEFRVGPWEVWRDAFLHAVYLEGAACLLMGVALPYLAAAGVPARDAGRASGRLYAVNTLAGVAGSALTGFALLPALGVQRSFLLLASLATLVGAVAVARTATATAPRAAAFGLWALSVAGLVGLPADHCRALFFGGADVRVLALREGTTTSAAVQSHGEFGVEVKRELATPGVSMSDTSLPARRYMGMMAHLGMFFAEGRHDALLICFGVGNTARALLSHPELARLDVVDISPEVLSFSGLFAQATGSDPLRDPRTHARADDGRHHLMTSGRRYDVITSEPPPPVAAGVVNLYSREYYAAARRALRPGGVLTQWLPIFQLELGQTLAIVAAVAAEFPYVMLFEGAGDQLILVGTDRAPRVDLAAWSRRASEPSIARNFAHIGVRGAEDLLGGFVQGDAALRHMVAHTEPLSDDRPTIQYPTHPVMAPGEPPEGLFGDPMEVFALVPGFRAESPEALPFVRAAQTTAAFVRAMPYATLVPPEFRELTYGTELQSALALSPAHPYLLEVLNVGDARVQAARVALGHDARWAMPRLVLASRAYYEGDYRAACEMLRALGASNARAPRMWTLRAGCERALGNVEAARQALATAVQMSASEAFRVTARALSATLAEPWSPTRGPLAPPPRAR
jgi:spermidine synthase